MSTKKLTQIALKIHEEIGSTKSAWQRIGGLLSEARALLPGDREFGKWVTKQKFGMAPRTLLGYRAAVEFTRQHAAGQNITDFTVALQLGRFTEEEQTYWLEQIRAGKKVTRSMLKKPKPKPKPAEDLKELLEEARVEATESIVIANKLLKEEGSRLEKRLFELLFSNPRVAVATD